MTDKYLCQNEREWTIWAARFAAVYDVSSPPRECAIPGNVNAWRAWESGQAYQAAESATYAVMAYREHVLTHGEVIEPDQEAR